LGFARDGTVPFSVFEAFSFNLKCGSATSLPQEDANMSLQIPVPASFLAPVWFGIDPTFGGGGGNSAKTWTKQTRKQNGLPFSGVAAVVCLRGPGCFASLVDGCPPNGLRSQHGGFFWFGAGLLVDNLADFPRRIRSIFQKVRPPTF
jgi:hypothetical protein